jgi:hypothetical protein
VTRVDPDSARVAAVRQWSVKAATLIDARIGDARAHAWNAITQRVVTAPDGRKTWQQAVLTRSYKAAVTRLDEIADDLAGPSKYSLDGLLRDARAAFYRDAFGRWNFEPQYLAPNPVPTKSGERVARGLVIHGYDLRSEVLDATQTASNGLQAAVTMAGRRDMTDDQARAVLDGWESQKAHAIRQRVDGLLNDSYVAILNLVGREMIDPKFHAEDAA